MTMLTLDLTEAGLQPELRGAVVYFLAQVKLSGTKSHLSARVRMMIDSGKPVTTTTRDTVYSHDSVTDQKPELRVRADIIGHARINI